MLNLAYIKLAAGALIVGGSFYAGYQYSSNIYDKKEAERKVVEAELRLQLKDLEVKSSKINTRTVVKYVDRVKQVTVKGDTIVKEVPVYVSQKSDAQCDIPSGFVHIHNASATNSGLPSTTRESNETTSGIRLSEVATTVSENYTKYHQVVEQLKALQDWIREQDNLINKK